MRRDSCNRQPYPTWDRMIVGNSLESSARYRILIELFKHSGPRGLLSEVFSLDDVDKILSAYESIDIDD